MFKKTLIATMLCFPLAILAAEFPSVNAVVENSQKIAAEKVQNQDPMKSAEDLAYDLLDSAGLELGWNQNGKGMLIAVGVATLDLKSLARQDQLLQIRPIKYVEASLNAKADIIKAIRTQLSADARITLPETGLSTDFDRRRNELDQLLEKRTKELKQCMEEAGIVKAQSIGGVNKEDFYREGIAAVLNKLGWNVEISKLKQEQAERVRQKESEVIALQAQIDALKKEIDENRAQLSKTSTNRSEFLASMPLSGAMTLAQFESVKDGEYQIAVVVGWSPEHAKYITNTFAGKSFTGNVKGTQTIEEYLAAQKGSWATSIGGRKFIDSDGMIHIIGIGAAPVLGTSSSARDIAKISAESQARSQIALALQGDVEAHSIVKEKVQEIQTSEGNKTDPVKSTAQKLSESVKDLPLMGAQTRFQRVLTYPLTNQKIFVNVVEYSLKNANLARKAEDENYQSAAKIGEQSQRYKGEKAGKDSVVEAARQNRAAYQEGLSSGVKAATPVATDNVRVGNEVKASDSTQSDKATLREGSIVGGGVDKSALMF